MKISVLIPAYQAAATLSRALASVQAQTHRDWDLYVVEDGSRDGAEEIVRRLARAETRAVRYENLGRNQGVAAARNRLLALAADAVAFLDADDWWAPGHLAAGLELLDGGAGLVATGVQTFDLASGRNLQEVHPPRGLVGAPATTLFRQSAIITSSSVFLSRALILRTGDFDPVFTVGEVRDYWLRAALGGARFAVAPGLTCHYAKHPRSAMGRTLVVAAENVRFYDKYRPNAALPAAARRHLLARSLITEGRLLRATRPRASARLLWRAWRLAPYHVAAAAHLLLSGLRSLLPS